MTTNAKTNYTEDAVMNHVLGKATWGAVTPALGLATAVTDAEAGTLTEVANSNNYARVAISSAFGTASGGGQQSNTSAIDFNTASDSWGTVTHAFIADSATHGGGNILYVFALDTSKAVGSGDTPSFAIGALTYDEN